MKLKDVVKTLILSYGDIRAEAKTYQFPEDEILAEIAKNPADSAENIVLKLLLENAIKAQQRAKK